MNNASSFKVEMGTPLSEVFKKAAVTLPTRPVAAKVNNVVLGMSYRIFSNKTIEFLTRTSPLGQRIYTRTLFFVLCKAVNDIYPEGRIKIEFPVSGGYYCQLSIGREVKADDAEALRKRMREIIEQKIPIRRQERLAEDVIKMFREKGDESKALILESRGKLYTIYSSIDDYNDYFYGPTLTNTGELDVFGLELYYSGLLLRVPDKNNPDQLSPAVRQDKMFNVFLDFHRWQDILHINTVGELNKAIDNGLGLPLILTFETFQEKKLSRIADAITSRPEVRIVLIAGPSSSGKTTTCKRLSVQLAANGRMPVGISMDDYFVDREKTPRDENGEYDFESLYTLNIPLFNEHLAKLINGEEIELPRYNFLTGKSENSGKKLRLAPDNILVIEGIHALNPELTPQIPNSNIFRVYASALTTLGMDNHNYIPTTDNRLLRRIIRDYKYRGVSARDTIKRWASVRKGEDKWIFPYQENADAMFNTAMLFELSAIKKQAELVLQEVTENCEEYAEATRLLEFLSYIKPLPENKIPPTSLLREFLGGSMFEY